jgi:hypothetical protein
MVTVYIDSAIAITSDNPFLSLNEFSRVNCICNEIISRICLFVTEQMELICFSCSFVTPLWLC